MTNIVQGILCIISFLCTNITKTFIQTSLDILHIDTSLDETSIHFIDLSKTKIS